MRAPATASIGAANDPLASLFDLEDQAEDFLDAGAYDEAISAAEAALAIDPKSLTARLAGARAKKALGRFAEAANMLEKALVHMPGLTGIHTDIALLYVELERLEEARDHLIRATQIDASLVQALANLGSVYMRMGQWDLAEPPTRKALALDADNLTANQNLAAIQANKRGQQARETQEACRQTFLVEKAYRPEAPAVLILSSSGKGNVPHQHLLPRSGFSRILWFFEDVLPEEEGELPTHDIVFNAVGDPDAAPEAHALACQFAQRARRPLLNAPDRVERTSRAAVANLLASCDTAVIPRVQRMERGAQNAPDLRYPVIARPAGRHGGEGAVLIEAPEQFSSLVPDAPAIYTTEFVNYRSPDGWYRKYRVIFIDRKPYPYHLAIGTHWLLHHWTAGMEQDAGRREEELRFLADPKRTLGDKVWATLEAIGCLLDLDFVGIDFSVLQDDRLLFFEANPTMLVHPEEDEVFAYRNFAVHDIIDAFGRMILRKIARTTAA